MFRRKKIAAVSALLGGLAMTCTGITQAHAAGSPGTCAADNEGNITCIQRFAGATPEGGGLVREAQTCVPAQPFTLPGVPLLNNGRTRIGPEVTCSPNATPATPAPDDSDNGLLGLLI